MTAKRCLGFTDEEGNPKDPVYAIGEVITAGKNLPSKRNHSQYIKKSGHYDIGRYLLDHKVHLPAILYHVGIRQLCPHISTEVDCEYLFSQAGYLADPRRARTDCCFYERLVITKHRLHQIYCHKPSVKYLFIKRWKSGDWKENIDRDDTQFLELEREIFQNDFLLYYADLFDDEDDEEEEEDKNNEDKHTGKGKDDQYSINNGLGRAKAAK
jgi:hypothetical protein